MSQKPRYLINKSKSSNEVEEEMPAYFKLNYNPGRRLLDSFHLLRPWIDNLPGRISLISVASTTCD